MLKKKLNDENEIDDQTKWELLKYEICKTTVTFSKNLARRNKKEQLELEKKGAIMQFAQRKNYRNL